MKKYVRIALATGLLVSVLASPWILANQSHHVATTERSLALGTHSLTLPNGTTLSYPQSPEATYQNLNLRLDTLGMSKVNKNNPFSATMVAGGTHAEILKEEALSFPYGTVHFALVERTAPAAEMTDAATNEYWLIAIGNDPNRPDLMYAYSLIATVTGNESGTKEKLLRLAQNWKLPITPMK